MKNTITQSMQPLLVEATNYNRFAGRYYLSSVEEGYTKTHSQKYWKLLISDASADLEVYCCNPELMQDEVQSDQWIHIEASLSQAKGTAYFRCKNVIANNQITASGLDMTALPRSVCPSKYAFDALFIAVNRIKSQALRSFVRSVVLQPDVGINFLRCPAIIERQYNYPGGLLEHAVDLALKMSDLSDISASERDIAIVAALFRDIDTIQRSCDELLQNLQSNSLVSPTEMCTRPLNQLAIEAPDIAQQLRYSWLRDLTEALSEKAKKIKRYRSTNNYACDAA